MIDEMRLVLFCGLAIASATMAVERLSRPNIVMVLTDDQGWGETGYYNHPRLKTPNLDAMAENGLRFDRFYAAAPVCSPTRASILTGRTNNRTGVLTHGATLRLQEKTLPAALTRAGYATAHFGKWHLNGIKGPGAPILADDPHSPGAFGFKKWLTTSNFFDIDPLLSRNGAFEAFKGTSSDVIVREALAFMQSASELNMPFFVAIWDGSPHSPWQARPEDKTVFKGLPKDSQNHYGELVAFDRSVGTLRDGLRKLGIAENTIVWYCSDNGGLKGIEPGTVGELKGFKGQLSEGGIRVPGIVEWPAVIRPRITDYPASTMDIFPTLVDILGLPNDVMLQPVDGRSLFPLFESELERRETPLPFRFQNRGAWIDNEFKLITPNVNKDKFSLYDLSTDPAETTDVSSKYPEKFERMKQSFMTWSVSVGNSESGKDYPESRVTGFVEESHFWRDDPRYESYFEAWRERPEYKTYLKNK